MQLDPKAKLAARRAYQTEMSNRDMWHADGGPDDTPMDCAIRAYLSALPASEAGWREITDEDRPPNDEEVLMGCWENWPSQKWMVEYGLYGSTKGGWIHGRMTHWLPSSFLPSAPDRSAS